MIYSKNILALILAISLPLSIASAAIDNATMQRFVDSHNSRIDNASQIAKSLAGNESIDLNITKNDGSVYRIGLKMSNARIIKTAEGGVNDSIISINGTEDAINRIFSSDDFMTALLHEMSLGRVAIRMHLTHNEDKGGRFFGFLHSTTFD